MAKNDSICKYVALIFFMIDCTGRSILITFVSNEQERQRIILRFADLVEKHNDEIAALETWDNGKPYEQSAKIEIPMFVRLMRYYAGGSELEEGNS